MRREREREGDRSKRKQIQPWTRMARKICIEKRKRTRRRWRIDTKF